MFAKSFRRSRVVLLSLFILQLVLSPLASSENVLDASGSEQSQNGANDQSVVLKRKVAIARFTNETQSGSTFLINESGDRIGKQASDILSARLAETQKFLMFERIDADKTDAEQMLSGMKEDGISVDYLIVGSVSEFGRSTESENGVFSRKKIQKAYAKVNIRLIDVATGRIIFASEGAGEATSEAKRVMGVGSSAGFDQSLTDKSLSAAISQLTSNLVESMTNKPWRSFVLAEQDGMYIISGGESQGIASGTELIVYAYGRKVNNPQTGAMITLPGSRVATLTIANSSGDDEFNEISFGTVSSGTLGADFSKYYISDK